MGGPGTTGDGPGCTSYVPLETQISVEKKSSFKVFFIAQISLKYTSDLKLKLLRGRNKHFKKIRAALWQPWPLGPNYATKAVPEPY